MRSHYGNVNSETCHQCVCVVRCAFILHIFCGMFSYLMCTPIVDDIWDEDTNNTQWSTQGLSQMRNIRGEALTFFPVPIEEECVAGRRIGVCMNPSECEMQGGSPEGLCALGFGACCTFTVTCEHDIYNNITYFVNPNFPDRSNDSGMCTVKIKKIDPDIVQFRLDFIHFVLGQPNHRSGVCEDDILVMSGGASKQLNLCGINSGQHVFFELDDTEDAIVININRTTKSLSHLWEIRIMQIPFVYRAPEGCLQYHTTRTGILQTMNYAENGRHLANQDYSICIRKEEGMCSIAYEPCDENSIKLGNNKEHEQYANNDTDSNNTLNLNNHLGGPISPDVSSPIFDDEDSLNDVGSGAGNLVSEHAQPRLTEVCINRIVLPCDNDDFLLVTGVPNSSQNSYCSLAHCGSSLCPEGERPCRVESNIIPFMVGVQFGASAREETPEENIGMCLIYEQQACTV